MKLKEHQTEKKLRGGYYTPPRICDYVSKWTLSNQPTNTVEPSCGDGAFVDSFIKYHSKGQLTAHEISPEEAKKVRNKAKMAGLANFTLHEGDYLAHAITALENGTPLYDAVLGNPPFIRYQFLDDNFKRKIERVFSHLDLKFTKHTNAWVPFILSCVELLKPGGRLGMVIPSEIIHVMHASALRKYLSTTCLRIMIIDPKELWFEGTQQGTVILMAIKKEYQGQKSKGISINHVKDDAFMHVTPDILFKHTPTIKNTLTSDKWTHALLSEKQIGLIDSIRKDKNVFNMGDISKTEVGIVTGANTFFLATQTTVDKFSLHQYIRPMFGKSDHCKGVLFNHDTLSYNAANNIPCHLIYLDKPIHEYPSNVKQYVATGESEGLDKRYKCRIRTPWYQVPSMHTTKVALWKRANDAPRLVYNEIQAHTTDTAYRVTPFDDLNAQRMVSNFLNPLTALSAELCGRYYGGGVLEVTPSEAAKLLIPMPTKFMAIDELDALLKSTSTASVLAQQGKAVLTEIGLTVNETQTVFEAWLMLKNRRKRL